MEYKVNIKEKKYRPAFGYGYDPDEIIREQEDERRLRLEEASKELSCGNAKGMNYPAQSPVLILIVTIVLFIAMFLLSLLLSLKARSIKVENKYQNHIVTDLCLSEREKLTFSPGNLLI